MRGRRLKLKQPWRGYRIEMKENLLQDTNMPHKKSTGLKQLVVLLEKSVLESEARNSTAGQSGKQVDPNL